MHYVPRTTKWNRRVTMQGCSKIFIEKGNSGYIYFSANSWNPCIWGVSKKNLLEEKIYIMKEYQGFQGFFGTKKLLSFWFHFPEPFWCTHVYCSLSFKMYDLFWKIKYFHTVVDPSHHNPQKNEAVDGAGRGWPVWLARCSVRVTHWSCD